MRKTLILIIIIISLMSSNIFAETLVPLEEKTQEELLHDAMLTLLYPATIEGITNCYKDILKTPPSFSKDTTHIIKVDRFNDGGTAYYIIEIEVEPYIAAHMGVGKDRLIIKVELCEPPTLLRSLHLIDYRLPERFNSYYLNDQPC